MRAHLYKVITDADGTIQPGTVVRVLQPDVEDNGEVLLVDTLFDDKVFMSGRTNPFTTTTGVVDFWLDTSQYVCLGLTPPEAVEYFIDNVEVSAPFIPAGTEAHAASHATGGTDALTPADIGAATTAEVSAKTTPAAAAAAAAALIATATASAMVVVNHGAVAGTARPVGAAAVYWNGSADPTNKVNGDLWWAP